MQCEEAQALTVDDQAPPEAREHVETCAECGPAVAEASRGRAALPDDGALPPAWLEDAVVTAVSAEAATGRPSREGKRRRWMAAGLVVAAAVAVLALVGGLLLASGGKPATHVIPLQGTAAAPDASGSVDVVEEGDGLRITLHLSGLRLSGPGFPYFMWVTTNDGRFTVAGNFHELSGPVTFRTSMRWPEWKSCGVNLADGSTEKGTTVLLPVGR